jgi:hypothetical protein
MGIVLVGIVVFVVLILLIWNIYTSRQICKLKKKELRIPRKEAEWHDVINYDKIISKK